MSERGVSLPSRTEYRERLRELMKQAGYRTLQQLQDGAARRGVQMPASTANRALNADKLPTADFVCRFVQACGGDVAWWLNLRDLIRDQDYVLRQATSPEEPAGVCPYPGLASFQAAHAQWYFGRERVVADLLRRLAGSTPLVVVGPSGAGKSSLLRAGLMPALSEGRLPGSRGWRLVVMTPTEHPMRELARHLGVDEVTGLAGVAVVLDQFEELFTRCADEQERTAFIELLCSDPALVAIGLRADFYGHCTAYPSLVEALRTATLPLGAMSTTELRDAIEKPARAVGLEVECGLVDVMLADLGAEDDHEGRRYEPGALPLLSYALFATWQHREGRRLTLAGYRLSGGLRGAIAASAERAYLSLGSADQLTAERLLVDLVQLGERTPDTRRSLALAGRAGPVLDVLASARLVTVGADSVEIVHEVVLRAWPRLRELLDRDRTRLLVRQRLADAAEQWDREGKHDCDLYREPRLSASTQFLEPSDPDLPPLARDFLAGSIDLARRQKRTTRWRRVLAAAVVVVLASVGVVAFKSNADAQKQRGVAVAQTAAYEAIALRGTNPDLAGQLSLAAFRMATVAETRGSLISGLVTPNPTQLSGGDSTDAVRAVTFSRDGRWLAAGGHDKAVRLFDATDPLHPRQQQRWAHGDAVRSIAFRYDSRWLASASQDHRVRLLEVGASDRSAVELDIGDEARDVAFSTDGTLLASAGHDDAARLWDVRDPRAPMLLASAAHNDDVYSVAFSPDSRILASAGREGIARLWDITDPRAPRLKSTIPHPGFINKVVFGPDGHTLVTAGTDATARLWDVSDTNSPTFLAALTGHTGPVHGSAFSPDGRVLVTTSVDVTARLWDVRDPRHPVVLAAPLAGHTDNVYSAAFHPDGHTLATASHDKMIKLWETDVDRVAAQVCYPSHQRMTAHEWERYFPGTDFTPPCR